MWRPFMISVVLLALQTQALVHSPPRITKQPSNDELLYQVAQQSNENDKPFIVECEAEGEPTPKYRWIKNGKNFDWQAYDDRMSQQPGRGTLVITSPRNEDMGQYQCFAENEHGIATSNSVFVRKAELNSFKDENPKNVSAEEGKPLKLQCQPPDGWPKPEVHWLMVNVFNAIKSINNSRMTIDPDGNLWFSNVTSDDSSDKAESFYYVCSAKSAVRNEYKLGNRILLQVVKAGLSPAQNRHEPVRQYVTRKNEVVIQGRKIELFCIFGGTPLPQIIWRKNGEPIRWGERVLQGNYGKSILIKTAIFEDEGSYTCEASNGVGNAQSYSTNLQVLAIPRFTIEPEVVNAAEDEVAEFQCEATGVPEPTIKWIFNGKPIEEAPRNERRSVSSNRIQIRNVLKSDTGNYGCNATNSLGYVYKDVYLNVLALAPEIVDAPGQQATVVERSVIMNCKVFGAPKPEVKWIRNGQELTGGRYKKLDHGELEITDVGYGDAGNYTCFARNKLGQAEANGTLIVKDKTQIIHFPIDYEAVAGKPVSFKCNAVSDPALDLTIEWLKQGSEINFEQDARFSKSNDNSLTISKTSELDSGSYTCLAKTELDEVSATAELIVQDVPNGPELTGIQCNSHDAKVSWRPLGDNRSPILYYTIQYNTSFTPESWSVAFEKVPATDFTYNVNMSPWANYTFRVIAFNKIGPSPPSSHSDVCTTQPEQPHKNPDNVEGKGTEPTNLVIYWTAMNQIDHNAPGFYYRVSYQRDTPLDKFTDRDVYNWTQSSFLVPDQPVFQRYRIKVVAMNDMGESNVTPREVIGYSGEDRPEQAPGNFSVLQVTGSNSAVLSWQPVPIESIRGHFKGYKIETWTEAEGEQGLREFHIKGESNQALINNFKPASKNFARIFVYNGMYNGPASNIVTFVTPEGVPSTVQSFEASPIGSSAFNLKWKEPLETNGVLTGYKIYYQFVNGTHTGLKLEREPHIKDPKIREAKIGGLMPNEKYRLYIKGTTKAGEGKEFFIERTTRPSPLVKPEEPLFIWEREPSGTGLAKIKVKWTNSMNQAAGSHFYVKYKEPGKPSWKTTEPVFIDDELTVTSLEPETKYEFAVVAVDGEFFSESQVQTVDTSGVDGPIKVPNENVATAGWFIGMILAIAFLILILCIICIIKRNRGGKYDVHDRELANGRRDFDEGGFHEYSQPLDNKSQGRQSLGSNTPKPGPESDTDSMAEYGEGDTGMNEDGSFIGQYGKKGRNPESNSQAFATLV